MKQSPRNLAEIVACSECGAKSLKSYLCGCRNPKVITKNDVTRTVPCGKCYECRMQKSDNVSYLLEKEHQLSKYAYNFTLTYDEYNCPILYVNQDYNKDTHDINIDYFEFTERRYKNGNLNLFSDYCQALVQYSIPISKQKNFDLFLQKAKPLSCHSQEDEIYHKDMDKIRYIRDSDLQNFIKRVRFQCSLLSDFRLRYFAVSEYGPQTFRPHFHVILFANSDVLARNLPDIVNRSWRLGEVRCASFVENAGNCASYLAGYLNSFSALPDYLNFSAIRPKSYHSQYLGFGFNRQIAEYCYNNRDSEFNEAIISSVNGDISYRPTPQMQNFLFPKCYNYEQQSYESLFQLYRCYELYAKDTLISSVVKDILLSPTKYISLLRSLDLVFSKPYNCQVQLPDEDRCLTAFLSDDITKYPDVYFVYNRISSAFYISKRFYNLYTLIGWNFYDAFNRLREHFVAKHSRCILKCHFAIEEYIKCYQPYLLEATEEDVILDMRYLNGLFYENNDAHKWHMETNHYVQAKFKENEMRAKERIKHKHLNDANNIFIDVVPFKKLNNGKKQTI